MAYNPYRSKESTGKFRSLLEKRFAAWVTNLKIKFLYEPIKIPYTIPEQKRNYIPDFVISKKKALTIDDLNDTLIIETKGRFVAADRKKMQYIKADNPNLDIRLIFPADEYLTKQGRKNKSGMRYSDWCEKYGFKYYIGTEPPQECFE